MGHHVQYDIRVHGDPEDVQALLEHIHSTCLSGKEVKWLSLGSLVPEPEGLDYDANHHWRLQHWGFLGENTCTVHPNPQEGLRLQVKTKGGHMIPVLRALSAHHPRVFLDVAFADDFQFCGRGAATNGVYIERMIEGHQNTPETRGIVQRVFPPKAHLN